VHRIGRTGRAGLEGEAVSFVCSEDRPLFEAIERLIKKTIDRREVPGFSDAHPGERETRPTGRPPRREERSPRPERKEAPRPEAPARDRPPRNDSRSEGRNASRSESRNGNRSEGRGENRGRRGPKPVESNGMPPMDFNKPYEPSPETRAPEPVAEAGAPRRGPQPVIPALFRRKV
jgi:ATP-dependent RNA helicase RhlE